MMIFQNGMVPPEELVRYIVKTATLVYTDYGPIMAFPANDNILDALAAFDVFEEDLEDDDPAEEEPDREEGY